MLAVEKHTAAGVERMDAPMADFVTAKSCVVSGNGGEVDPYISAACTTNGVLPVDQFVPSAIGHS